VAVAVAVFSGTSRIIGQYSNLAKPEPAQSGTSQGAALTTSPKNGKEPAQRTDATGGEARKPIESDETLKQSAAVGGLASDPQPKKEIEIRPPAQVLRDLAQTRPKRTGGRTAGLSEEDRQETSRRRAELIGELFKADAAHPSLPGLLAERWLALRDAPLVKAEHETAAERPSGDPIGDAASYVAARLAVEDPVIDGSAALEAINTFAARSKARTPRVAELLGMLADQKVEDPAERRKLYLQIAAKFPKSREAEAAIRRLAQLDEERFQAIIDPNEAASDPRIGKVFEFAFQDAISGRPISSDALRGRVLVIDFWATWCDPCIKSIPKMKEHYAKYNPQGVVFIGVSLDSADIKGVQKLLNGVAEYDIPWPQFHQRNGELSKEWAVSAIPTVFVIDQAGRVVTTKGNLDGVLPKLLKDAAPAKKH
jgi:thiol-disulfide isomerase/thioredoxin